MDPEKIHPVEIEHMTNEALIKAFEKDVISGVADENMYNKSSAARVELVARGEDALPAILDHLKSGPDNVEGRVWETVLAEIARKIFADTRRGQSGPPLKQSGENRDERKAWITWIESMIANP